MTGARPWDYILNARSHRSHGAARRLQQCLLGTVTDTEVPPFQYPSGMSAACRHFFECCFQVDPDKRPNATELLRHEFILSREIDLEGSENESENDSGCSSTDDSDENDEEEKTSETLTSKIPLLQNIQATKKNIQAINPDLNISLAGEEA